MTRGSGVIGDSAAEGADVLYDLSEAPNITLAQARECKRAADWMQDRSEAYWTLPRR